MAGPEGSAANPLHLDIFQTVRNVNWGKNELRYVTFGHAAGGDIGVQPMRNSVAMNFVGEFAWPSVTDGYPGPDTNSEFRAAIDENNGYFIAYPYIDPTLGQPSSFIHVKVGRWIVDHLDYVGNLSITWQGVSPGDNGTITVPAGPDVTREQLEALGLQYTPKN